MTRSLLGMFDSHGDAERIADAIMEALKRSRETLVVTTDDSTPNPDDHPPTRLDPGGGDPSLDPYSREQLIQAQIDRIAQMSIYDMTEEDFGDEAIWIVDDDGNYITDVDDWDG